MNSSRTQQCRRAAQFDDATLARKREYWRTKKREQRAKLSALKKEKHGMTHGTSCKPVLSASAESSRVSMVVTSSISPACSLGAGHGFTPVLDGLEGPTLLNSDGSYAAVTSNAPPSLLKNCPFSDKYDDDKRTILSAVDGIKNWGSSGVTPVVSAGHTDSYRSCCLEENETTVSNQKEGCFEKTKPPKVFPPFSKACSGPIFDPNSIDVCNDINKCLPVDIGKGTFATAKPNGSLLTSCSEVPAIQMELPLNSSLYSQLHNDTALVNGSSNSGLSENHTESQMELGHSNNSSMQVGTQSRGATLSLTASTGTKVKIVGNPCSPVTGHTLGIKSTNVTPVAVKKSANVIEASTALGSSQTGRKTVETEEDKAARRREYWRVKKREQRAKLTARLAKAREKARSVITPVQKTEQSSCMVVESASSGWCKDGQMQTAGRVRTPLIPANVQRAGRLLRNARAVAASCSASRCSSLMVKKEPFHSDPVVGSAALPDCVFSAASTRKEKTQGTTALRRASTNTLPQTALRPEQVKDDERWVFTRSRAQRQRYPEAQRVMSQQRMRRPFSPAAALMPARAQRSNTGETAEEKLARKREYWRVKKREQRAKHSAEVKARMKERDALLQRVRRYQSILEEMRKARAGVGDRPLHPPQNAFTDDSEAIGGFIKEDGTVTTEIPHASGHLRLPASETTPVLPSFRNAALTVPRCDVSSNPSKTGPVRRMQVKVSPSFGSTQAKESGQHPVNRTVFRSASKIVQQLHGAVPQISASQRHAQNVQTTYPRITLIKHRPNAWQVTRMVDNMSFTRAKQRTAVMAGLPGSKVALTASCQTSPLTEEEKMAKKREYWRIKKREQRAKRSASGRSLFKRSTNILRPRNHRALVAQNAASLASIESSPSCMLLTKRDIQLSTSPQENVKQERDDSFTEANCSVSNISVCPDIKPLPLSPAGQQSEPDSTLNADSQDATLLAVASMKKLLEESLSTVTDCNGLSYCKSETLPCKREEGAADQEVKANLSDAQGGDKDSVIPEQKQPEVKTSPQDSPVRQWQVQVDKAVSPKSCHAAVEATSTSQPVCEAPRGPSSSALPPLSTAPCSTSPPCSQPPPLRRALRSPAGKTGHCCTSAYKKQPHGHSQPEVDVIQKKREYWRVMKREQRARKAARDKERKEKIVTAIQVQDVPKQKRQEQAVRMPVQDTQEGLSGGCRPILPANIQQGPSICVVKLEKTELPPAASVQCVQPPGGGSLACQKAASALPTLLVMSPAPSVKGVLGDSICAKPSENRALESPRHAVAESPTGAPSKQRMASPAKTRGNEGKLLLLGEGPGSSPESPRVRRWRLHVPEGNNTQPCQLAPPFTGTTPKGFGRSPNKHESLSTKVPSYVTGEGTTCDPTETPKPTLTPVEFEEDVRQRKREYWRGRKREQRARKAARDRELKQKVVAKPSMPLLTVGGGGAADSLEQQEQNSGQWFNCTEETGLLHSTSQETDLGLLPQLCHMSGVNGEMEMGPLEVEDEDEEEGVMGTPASAAAWRSRFLMDYDPLNQLLVCMVCGELQHSHTLEGVRAHIEEAHPDTVSLGPRERSHIQEAWDEQVSVRERFFSSQLQQQVSDIADTDPPAEVEVLVDLEDFATVKNGKTSKSKSLKKL